MELFWKIANPIITALVLALIYWMGRKLRDAAQNPDYRAAAKVVGPQVLKRLLFLILLAWLALAARYSKEGYLGFLNWIGLVLLVVMRCMDHFAQIGYERLKRIEKLYEETLPVREKLRGEMANATTSEMKLDVDGNPVFDIMGVYRANWKLLTARFDLVDTDLQMLLKSSMPALLSRNIVADIIFTIITSSLALYVVLLLR